MIGAFHRAGISVILDVVFNHVYIEKSIDETIYEKIVPGYYFRYHPDGSISNSTGCGNDIATERYGSKTNLNTIDLWLSEYKVDGFDSDLMGVLDVTTMERISARCQEESVPIMLLGEGWDLPTALPQESKAIIQNAHKLTHIRFFNDSFRDTLKGNIFHAEEKGFVNGSGRFMEKLATH